MDIFIRRGWCATSQICPFLRLPWIPDCNISIYSVFIVLIVQPGYNSNSILRTVLYLVELYVHVWGCWVYYLIWPLYFIHRKVVVISYPNQIRSIPRLYNVWLFGVRNVGKSPDTCLGYTEAFFCKNMASFFVFYFCFFFLSFHIALEGIRVLHDTVAADGDDVMWTLTSYISGFWCV